MYDVIGDIHGHADELEQLLAKLGYAEHGGVYSHPTRKVLFLGDFVDRGLKILRTLQIARSMVEADAALAVMGNHEFNALAYHTADPREPDRFLRQHSRKNEHQHQETLKQLDSEQLASYLAWMRTLPLWLELDGLRAVHACWDRRALRAIAEALPNGAPVDATFLTKATKKDDPLFDAVEVALKGKEAPLPTGRGFADKDGNRRTAVRVRWYLSPAGHTYRSYAMTDGMPCDEPLAAAAIDQADPYPADAPPVFFGHYWLTGVRPELLAPNVACLDYSVAKKGVLCAYRWDGERILDESRFVWVDAADR